MTVRLIFKRINFDAYGGQSTDSFETLDVECAAIQVLLQRGGSGESGYDITRLIGAEVLQGPQPALFTASVVKP